MSGVRLILQAFAALAAAAVVAIGPMVANGSTPFLAVGLSVALAIGRAMLEAREYPRAGHLEAIRAGIQTALPLLAGLLLAGWVARVDARWVLAAGTGGAVWLAFLVQGRRHARVTAPGDWMDVLHHASLFVSSFVIFTLVYQTKERSLYTATTITVVATLAAFALYRFRHEARYSAVLYAGITGLAVGELTWAINYWASSGLVGGALLLLLFYVMVGLFQAQLDRVLDRHVALEYGVVGLIGLTFIMATAPWRA